MSALRTMKTTLLCASLWLLTFVACEQRSHSDEQIDGWHTSVEAGCRAAETSGKPVLLVFR